MLIMEFSIVGIITIFIAASIMITIGTTILGSVNLGENCDNLTGSSVYIGKSNITSGVHAGKTSGQDHVDNKFTKTAGELTEDSGKAKWTADSGWSRSCWEVQEQSASSYGLLVLIILVIAAVGVLGAIRLLGA